jgi:hypothetical protein
MSKILNFILSFQLNLVLSHLPRAQVPGSISVTYVSQYRKKTIYVVVSSVTNGHALGHIHFRDRGHIKENRARVIIKT